MKIHELKNLEKKQGVIFEVTSVYTTKVARYAKPYGEYIEDEIIRDNVVLEKYITPKETFGRKPSFRTLVRRAALDICPDEKVVYFEIM